jgi:hypothetical protein
MNYHGLSAAGYPAIFNIQYPVGYPESQIRYPAGDPVYPRSFPTIFKPQFQKVVQES